MLSYKRHVCVLASSITRFSFASKLCWLRIVESDRLRWCRLAGSLCADQSERPAV